jgi:hypothetical protein
MPTGRDKQPAGLGSRSRSGARPGALLARQGVSRGDFDEFHPIHGNIPRTLHTRLNRVQRLELSGTILERRNRTIELLQTTFEIAEGIPLPGRAVHQENLIAHAQDGTNDEEDGPRALGGDLNLPADGRRHGERECGSDGACHSFLWIIFRQRRIRLWRTFGRLVAWRYVIED